MGAPQESTTSESVFEQSPETTQERQQRLLSKLKDSLTREEPETKYGLDKVVFGVAGVLAIAFVTWGFVNPHSLGTVSDEALAWTMANFGWLFVIAASVFVFFVVFVALSRFGKIPLGRDGEAPEFRTSSWIAMMFATGMGIGLMFYGVGEPLWFYMSPPPGTVDAQSVEAAATAMGTTLFHWTLYPWAMYALVGLGMAYGTFRLGRSQLFSSMFTSLFGYKAVNGVGGRIINILAIAATLFGSACSLGLGALQIGGGLQATGLFEQMTSTILVAIIAVLTAGFVASAVSGVARGIQWLSNINMVLALLLAVIVFIGGPTLFILNMIPSAIGNFISELPGMASRTSAVGDEDVAAWLSSWTIFYWAWWISWTPFVGMFIARISRGRTVRQFIAGVLFVPSVVSLMWFAIFGGGAIGLQERAERAGDTSAMLAQQTAEGPDINFDLVLFDLLNALPVPQIVTIILMVLAVLLVAIFFITGADSASIVMGGISENGAVEPSKGSVIFWGVATGAVAAAMLLAGGSDPSEALSGLQRITIVAAVPFVAVMLLLCVAIYKDLSADPLVLRHQLASQVLVDSVTTATATVDGEQVETIELQTATTNTGQIPVVIAQDGDVKITSRTLGVPGSAPYEHRTENDDDAP
ncbi:BCCT family transporter [Kocuria sp.]|uniref:BCCT family transporter n=1 Tax=Kocuria sp. TaxID=1871328 RepID=UPI0026E0E159|nr:BCCT family transporter [Kocuria sp.]MDO5617828.1 BCCT family transporter [Kocuria sp.]